ncbi:MAG: hypothetical protein IKD04_08990 [Clostridia bacterium]|nr:hypothetical protein [Clostridia bacterium]
MNVSLTRADYDVRQGFSPSDYSFTVDWLNVRLDCDDIGMLILAIINKLPELELSDFEPRPGGGVCFYKCGYHIPKVGFSSIVLAYNTDEKGKIINTPSGKRGELYGILVSISGDGCRFINSLHDNAFCDFLDAISIFNPQCSRIDLACDILDKENQIVPMIHTFAATAYDRENALIDLNCGLIRKRPDGKYRQWVKVDNVYDDVIDDITYNVTVGGRNSTKGTLQLYNKRVEINERHESSVAEAILNAMGDPDYWWRLEYRCKSYAQNVFDTLVQSKNVYAAFLEACTGFGEFVVSPYDISNIHKAQEAVEWAAFLCFLRSQIDTGIHLVQFTVPKLTASPYLPSVNYKPLAGY